MKFPECERADLGLDLCVVVVSGVVKSAVLRSGTRHLLTKVHVVNRTTSHDCNKGNAKAKEAAVTVPDSSMEGTLKERS